MLKPLAYQKEAYRLTTRHLANHNKALIVMATGLGKTLVAAMLAKKELKESRNVLILCHDNGILDQTKTEFQNILGNQYSFKTFYGAEKDWDADKADVLFASFQTMHIWKEVFLKNEFANIYIDESHHAQAKTYKNVIDYFNPKKLIGLTATPDREDEKDIRDIFGKEIVNYSLEESISYGWLTSVEYHVITDNLNTIALRKLTKEVGEGKKVSIKQLNESVFVDTRDEKVAEIIKAHAKNKKTLIFCERIEHVENFKHFLSEEITRTYHSGNSVNENNENLQSFCEGKTQYILAVDKFNEGIDVPNVEVVVFLRCTDSKRIFFQQLGRGLRKIEGKEKVIILDFVANCERVAVLKEMTDEIQKLAKKRVELDKNRLTLSGKSFKFIFTDEQRDMFELLKKIRQSQYISDIPELLEEYHPTKNDLPPNKVLAGTNKKVWWVCQKPECGYAWETTGVSRVNGTGCPACSNQVVTEKNNLTVTHPELAKEYHLTKNTLPPNQVIAGTHSKLWWKCSRKCCGYEWEAVGNNRVNGTGCPACSNQVVTEKNNLTVTHPELAKEYHPTKNTLPPNQVIAGTRSKLWWKCSRKCCGHEWEARGEKRVGRRGCPVCANKRRGRRKKKNS